MSVASRLPEHVPSSGVASPGAREWEVAVVGAGPAGAMAALELARLGAQVLLIDRAAFPRSKVCGCCLNLRATAALREAGLDRRIAALAPRPIRRIHLAAGRARASLDLPGGVSLSRERLDAMLIDAAVEAGATFLPGARARLLDAETGTSPGHVLELVRAGAEVAGLVRARVVVAADGLGGAFAADRLGGERVRRGSRIGASAVLSGSAQLDWRDETITMTIGRGGYVGAVRIEDGRWNVAAALDADAVRRHGGVGGVACAVLEEAGQPVPRDLRDATWQGTPRLWRRPSRVAAGRLFVVGDAAGYVEPFTGEGMGWALTAGRALAPIALRAVRAWEPGLAAEWTRILRREVQRGQMLCRATAHVMGNRVLAVGATALLGALPRLAGPVVGWLNAAPFGVREGGGS